MAVEEGVTVGDGETAAASGEGDGVCRGAGFGTGLGRERASGGAALAGFGKAVEEACTRGEATGLGVGAATKLDSWMLSSGSASASGVASGAEGKGTDSTRAWSATDASSIGRNSDRHNGAARSCERLYKLSVLSVLDMTS